MNQFDFIKRRESSWKDLEAILAQWSKKKAAGDDVRRLGRLYREATADLAVARTDFTDSQIVPYLNRLVADGHSVIYGNRVIALTRVWRFFRRTFPEALAAAKWYFLVATLIFSLTAVTAAAVVRADPGLSNSILPQTVAKQAAAGGSRTQDMSENAPEVSAFITVNNIQVALVAFALGIFLGLGTLYALTQNGIILGALAAVFSGSGASLQFWSLILPHGMLELPAIFIASAAGLMLGDALVRPKEHKRSDALRLAARQAVILVGGTIPMFIAAGLIEGFVTPSAIPEWTKFSIAVLTGATGLLYCTGRPSSRSRSKEELAS